MEVFPVMHVPTPATRTGMRRSWAMLVRNRWLVLGTVAAALLAGLLVDRNIEPQYESSSSVRIDQRGDPAGNASLVATANQVLTSRSLANQVADSLGLRLVVDEPRGVERVTVIAAASVESGAPLRRYRVSSAANGQVTVQPLDASPALPTVTVNASGEFALPGIRVRLAPMAMKDGDIVLRVASEAEATSFVHDRTTVTQPNPQANIAMVTWRGADAVLARDIVNALSGLFVQERVEAELAGPRGTVTALRLQVDTITRDLRAKENTVNAFIRTHPVVNVEADATQRAIEIGRLTELRVALAADRDLLAATLNVVTDANNGTTEGSAVERLLSVPAFLRAQSASGSASMLANRLHAQEDQRNLLLTRLDPNDPDVKSVERQIDRTRRDIRATAEAFVAGLSEQVRSYDARMNDLRRAGESYPAQQLILTQLQRQQRLAEDLLTVQQSRLKDAEIVYAAMSPTVHVLDRADAPGKPLGSTRPFRLALWLLGGLLLGCFAAYMNDRLDTSVHDEQDVLSIALAPVIGIIPYLAPRSLASRGRAALTGGSSEPHVVRLLTGTSGEATGKEAAAVEAYRALRTNLAHVNPAKPPRVLMVTSALSGDGKTTSAANLAVTLAQQGKRVLLVDAETRRGNLHTLFGIEASPGFFDLLYGQASATECIRRVTVGGVELDILPSGGEPNSNAADLLVPGLLAPFLATLRAQYDYVLIDTPPINRFTDAALIGAQADATLLVARADTTDREALRFAVQQLRHVQAHVAGTILNGVDLRRNSRYQGGYDLGRYSDKDG